MVKYRTIVIDPPWEYDRATGLGSTGAAADHYATMTNAEIAALPVRSMADTNAHIYVWVTNPRLFPDESDGLGPRALLALAILGVCYLVVWTAAWAWRRR